MAKRSRETPMYRVWRPDVEEESDGRDWGAIDVRFAARLHAEHGHNHCDWREVSWPLLFHVRDPDGSEHVVEVERHLVPEFYPGAPVPAKMNPMVHAFWSGVTVCADIRLRDVPGRWPEGQTFATLRDLFTGEAKIGQITCPRCKKFAMGRVDSLKAIGAFK